MTGNNIDKQKVFLIQIGADIRDGDKVLAEELVIALKMYGFKDAQVLGVALVDTREGDARVTTDALVPLEDEQLEGYEGKDTGENIENDDPEIE